MKICLAIFGLFPLLISCDNETVDYPNASGDIMGYVRSRDSQGLADESPEGIQAELIGRVNRTVVTTDFGKFYFSDVPAGSYQLRISKEGYDAYLLVSLIHLGGTPTIVNIPEARMTIAAKPDFRINSWSIDFTIDENDSFFSDKLLLTCTFDKETFQPNFSTTVLLSDKPGVSESNFLAASRVDFYSKDEMNVYQNVATSFPHRLIHGKTYYAKIYPYNYATTYKDVDSRLIIPSLGEPAQEISFIAE